MLRNGDYPLTDGRGNTRVATNSSGTPDFYQNPDASGAEWGQGGSAYLPYHWGADSGYRMDGDGPAGGESPYYKVGSRYYDPDAGRFISRDTDLSQAPYAYCGGDPGQLHRPRRKRANEPGQPADAAAARQ